LTFRLSVEDAVLLGAFAELLEVLVEGDEAEVEDVDAVAEVLESDLGPDSAECGDGMVSTRQLRSPSADPPALDGVVALPVRWRQS
jgi:hypothetical protein